MCYMCLLYMCVCTVCGVWSELLPSEQAEDLVELTTLKVAYNKMGRKQAEFNHFITSAPV